MDRTKKRVNELLKLFPTAEDMGRAYIYDFIEQRKAAAGLESNRIFKSSEEANSFMEGVKKKLKTQKEIDIFNKYVILRENIVKVLNATMFARAVFYHAYYKIAYITEGIINSLLKATFLDSPKDKSQGLYASQQQRVDMFFSATFDSDCRDLPYTWQDICHAITTTFEEKIFIEYLGERYNIDFSAIYPELDELIADSKKNQNMIDNTIKALDTYQTSSKEWYTSIKKILQEIKEDNPMKHVPKDFDKFLKTIFPKMLEKGDTDIILGYLQRNI